MSSWDWQRKINDAIDQIRNSYGKIGRKTGAPFLGVVYPPEAERAVFKEWNTQKAALQPEYAIHEINLLDVTQEFLSEAGVENVVAAIEDPMPGSDAQEEMARIWITKAADRVGQAIAQRGNGKPVVSLERLAALYPAAGPKDLMQTLWGREGSMIECPVVVLIPGSITGTRNYSFLGKREEFMYRGNLL